MSLGATNGATLRVRWVGHPEDGLSPPPPIYMWGGGESNDSLRGVRFPRAVALPGRRATHMGRVRATPGAAGNPASTTTLQGGGESSGIPVFEQLRDLSQHGSRARDPLPLDLDFEVEPEPPDYIVDRLFERQTVNVLSGDTGAGKSLVMSSLVVAMCAGSGEWLGREVRGDRALVVDEENPARIVRDRLRALGLTNEHRDRLRYFNRQGFSVGDPRWTAELREAAKAHNADVVVIDTAAAATAADVNDNDAVARLYSEALRPLATDLNLAVIVLHHERKPQPGQTRDPGQAMMGARQWAAQADTHVSLRVSAPLTEKDPADDGSRQLVSEFVIRTPKMRDGEPDVAHVVVVESVKDAAGRLVSMEVLEGGRYEREPSKADALTPRIIALLQERGEMLRGSIAQALEVDSGTLDRSLGKAVDTGCVEKRSRGKYGPAPEQPGI